MEMNTLWAGQLKYTLIQYFSHLWYMATLKEYSTQNWNIVFFICTQNYENDEGKSEILSPWEDPSKEHQPYSLGLSKHWHGTLGIFMSNVLF